VSAPAARAAEQAAPRHRRLGIALVVISAAQLMVMLDLTIVNVALPSIQRSLGFSVTFAGASLAGGLATTQAWLITARTVQGVDAAIASPTALALVATTFREGRERNRAMAV
jgi:MFS family permease